MSTGASVIHHVCERDVVTWKTEASQKDVCHLLGILPKRPHIYSFVNRCSSVEGNHRLYVPITSKLEHILCA